jgi:DegV family protein with EDD domain
MYLFIFHIEKEKISMVNPEYIITTDSNTELPLSIAKAYSVPFVPMDYLIGGQEFFYDLGENTDFKAFFAAVRSGQIPSTSTYPPQYYVEFWRPMLEAGKDILHIAFSSNLSAAFRYLSEAIEELKTLYPDRQVVAVDTRSISGGAAMLVYGALQRYGEGASLEDVRAWLDATIPFANHWFTVNDLNHLRRGGRLSTTTAIVGSVLNIKPILTLNKEGKIVPFDKVMGRRKALNYLADKAKELAVDPEHNAYIILHGDCLEEAQELKAMIEAAVPFRECFLQFVGPVIGTHAGPDVMGLCFIGKERMD